MFEYTAQLGINIILDSFVSAYGLLAYVVVLRPLLTYRRVLFSNPFYTACFALAFLDILYLIDRMCLKISDPLLPVTHPYILQIRSFYERCIWYGIACVQFVVALERTLAIFVIQSFAFSNKLVVSLMASLWFIVVATNFCILTPVCPYVWYPNTTTVFIDLKIPAAVWHNKIVDWCLQPMLMSVTVLLYIVSGFRVFKVRNKVFSQTSLSSMNAKKLKMQHVLFLHGLLVSLPHTIVIVVYHIMFYCPTIPMSVHDFLEFLFQFMSTFGCSLNPILHLVLNTELRHKAVECWCSESLSSLRAPSILRMNSPRRSTARLFDNDNHRSVMESQSVM